MDRAARTVQIIGLALVLATGMRCGGERVRLGDAIAGEDATTAGVGAGERGGAGYSYAGSGGKSSGGTGGRSTGGAGGHEAGSGGTACQRGQIKANEVLWIGDTWVTIPGIQHERVRDLARASGAIGPDDDYIILAAPAAFMAAIANQYTQGAEDGQVKVLIMDGGTWDTLTGNGSPASVAKAASDFKELLDTIASDGTVEHIIYFLQPELPGIAGVAALRPEVERACRDSSVPCHFLDLQPLWAGHPEYTADGIQASEAGAIVIAESIWGIMRDNCIAQ